MLRGHDLHLNHQVIQDGFTGRLHCSDNAVAESFFATLKKEAIYGNPLTTRQALRAEVFEYIECDYNRTRRHSTIGWVSPIRFEHNHQQRSEVVVV